MAPKAKPVKKDKAQEEAERLEREREEKEREEAARLQREKASLLLPFPNQGKSLTTGFIWWKPLI